MTDYTGQMTATEDIMRPQTPYKLAFPARVYGQGAPARLVVTLKIECLGRGPPLPGLYKALHELEALQTRRSGGSAPLARLDVDGFAGN
jgi:hypothetical protein